MSCFEGWMKEGQVAIYLGVSRAWLRKARFDVPGAPEALRRVGKTFYWSPAGVNTLRRQVLGESLDSPAPEKTQAADNETTPEPERCKVLRLFPNRHLLLAEDAHGSSVRVRVSDSSNFMPKMVIKARQIERDLYELVGRAPRYRGRW